MKDVDFDLDLDDTTIIGIAGKKSTGKDTLAKKLKGGFLLENTLDVSTDDDVLITSVADPMKNFAIDAIQANPRDCFGPSERRDNPTPIKWEWVHEQIQKRYPEKSKDNEYMSLRTFLKSIGGLMREEFSNVFWLVALFLRIEASQAQVAILPDIRTEREIEYCKRHIDFLIGLERSDINHDDEDKTETELEPFFEKPDEHFDAHYDNDGSLRELGEFALSIVRRLEQAP